MAPFSSQLRALVRADIVGSTQTLSDRGVAAAVSHRRLLGDTVLELLGGDEGPILAVEGDGYVLGFRSAARALSVAVGLRDRVAARGAFSIRVGATLDEIAVDATGAYVPTSNGDLARVEAIERSAEDDEVLLDDRIRRAALGVAELKLEAIESSESAGTGAVGQLHRLDHLGIEPSPPTRCQVVMFASYIGESGPVREAVQLAAAAVVAEGGQIVDRHGPGHVVAFDSARHAIRASLELQSIGVSLGLRADTRGSAKVTIGLALGDVASTEGDRFGPAVVEAARLHELGEGAIVMSDDVRSVAGEEAGASTAIGWHDLKGLPEPVSVHRLDSEGRTRPLVEFPRVFAREPRFAFQGRSDHLVELGSSWSRAQSGEPVGVVITGQEGGGKTRLARELAKAVFDEGAVVLHGACDDTLRSPYAPVARALERAGPVDEAIGQASRDGGGPLGPLFAADHDRPDRAGELGVADVDRIDLFDAVAASLGRLASLRPVLLVIDDMQWATADTVELLEHVLADRHVGRLLVVLTCRAGEIDRSHPVQRLFTSERTAHRVTQRRLDRLTIDEVGGLLESRAGYPLTAVEQEFAAELSRVTGGSPLFIEELLVHFASTGVLVRDDRWRLVGAVDELAVPDSVVDLMARRLARLGPDIEQVLTIAAVVGSTFRLDVVASVADRSLDDVFDAMEAAGDVGLVHEDDGGDTCSFGDEITREALLRSLRPTRRARVHRVVAEALEQLRPVPVTALAHHWDSASGADSAGRAIHYLSLAAQRDISSAAWETAIERLGRAFQLLDRVDDVDDRVNGELHYGLGLSLRMIGRDDYRPELTAAATIARRRGDGHLLARTAIAMMRPGAWYPEAAVVDDEITEMCEEALSILGPDGPDRVRVLSALATNLSYDPDVERRRSLIEEAQRLAEADGDPELIGTALAAELIARQEPDLFERRLEVAREVRRIGRSTGNRNLTFTGGMFVLLEYGLRGEFAEVARAVDELEQLADAGRAYWPRYLITQFRTLVAVARCRPDVEEIIEAGRLAFEDQPVDSFGMAVIQRAAVAMTDGSSSEMLLPFAEVMAEWEDNAAWSQKWNYAFAKAYLDAGDLEAAVRAVELHPEPEFDRYWVASLLQLGLLGLELGREDYCQRLLDRLTPFRGRFAIIGMGACIGGQVSTALGQAALGLGDLDYAEELFREAIEQADDASFPYFATTGRRFLAATLLRQDERASEAQLLLDEVDEASAQYGFAAEAEAAQALRASLVG